MCRASSIAVRYRKARRRQHEVGRGARRVGRAADRDADIGLFQRRRVIHPVAGHADDMAGALQRLDDLEFVFGKDAREAVGGDDVRKLFFRSSCPKTVSATTIF